MNKKINELTSPYFAEEQEEADITSVLKLVGDMDLDIVKTELSNSHIMLCTWNHHESSGELMKSTRDIKIPLKQLDDYTPQETEDLLTLLEKLLGQ